MKQHWVFLIEHWRFCFSYLTSDQWFQRNFVSFEFLRLLNGTLKTQNVWRTVRNHCAMLFTSPLCKIFLVRLIGTESCLVAVSQVLGFIYDGCNVNLYFSDMNCICTQCVWMLLSTVKPSYEPRYSTNELCFESRPKFRCTSHDFIVYALVGDGLQSFRQIVVTERMNTLKEYMLHCVFHLISHW